MSTIAPFRILTVCTENICRSPMVEMLLQRVLDLLSPGGYRVLSAGTGALVGSAMDPHIEGYVRALGATAEGFEARQPTPEMLAEQDIVLSLTRSHRSRIVELHPALLKKTSTLRELGRVLPGVQTPFGASPLDRWAAVIEPAPAYCRDGHS